VKHRLMMNYPVFPWKQSSLKKNKLFFHKIKSKNFYANDIDGNNLKYIFESNK
jgi:hypothetical protein